MGNAMSGGQQFYVQLSQYSRRARILEVNFKNQSIERTNSRSLFNFKNAKFFAPIHSDPQMPQLFQEESGRTMSGSMCFG